MTTAVVDSDAGALRPTDRSTPVGPRRDAAGPWWWVAHVGVFGLVAEVAFVHLGTADAAPDEYTYYHCGQAYLHGNFGCNPEHPPLAKEILGLGSLLFGDSLTAARAVTAVFAVLTAYACYLFCRDVAGRAAGLVAAAMWGLLPQAGVENHTTLEAVRVDRFALLDPFVATFVAFALVAGARLARRGGAGTALLLGGAVAAAACAKAPGALIAPVACVIPLVMRKRRGLRVAREAVAIVVGGIVVGAACYAPRGPVGAFRAIQYMFDFQTAHAAREVVVGGHFYTAAPWWSDLAFATGALGAVLAVTLALLVIAGTVCSPRAGGYALAVGASIVIGVGVGLHLSAPHYFIDWEPAVIDVAALGIVGVASHVGGARVRGASSSLAVRVAAAVVVLAVASILVTGGVRTVSAANTVRPGPYAAAARVMRCDHACVVAYVGFLGTFAGYLPADEYLSAVPPSTRVGRVVARVRADGKVTFAQPDIVALDPAAYVLHGSWRKSIRYFEAHWQSLGYRRVPSASRIEVYRRTNTAAFGPDGLVAPAR